MPIGIQRLNAKTSQPNPHIVFIKPLKGRDEKIAQDFLERIAAQCLPVMRKHHIHVMSLEEFPPNREFVGRNFNAGEVIQLVLKAPGSGRWLPFNYVQMVMMHELAHCAQMNHSRAFWAVRNQYAEQMQALWAEGYKGDGLWGRGATLGTGEWEKNSVHADEVLPEHLCGGTYRSRGRKRKVKPVLTYQERKERRILKKFGKNGVVLGADEEEKVKLEKGKRVQAKPRVAGSLRGRELRAAAALARFEQSKDGGKKEEEEEESIKDWDEESSDYEDGSVDSKPAVDVDGTRMLDRNGDGMVKVCEDEDANDADARNELDQLHGLFKRQEIKREPGGKDANLRSSATSPTGREQAAEVADDVENDTPTNLAGPKDEKKPYSHRKTVSTTPTPLTTAPATATATAAAETSSLPTCSMCSFENPKAAVTCGACANVLHPATPGWRCDSASCKGTAYVNSQDCGVCGLCGQKRGS
ncbi:WLM-domain-containing protein [Trichoderma citrinoviride]|uniref:WLM-domain-containing protein n=1 Tax=Trichoderma citrinoviride TaxID=58853 RepID=A0A2T4BCV4_9HYPO|nr:WLM-domain-containing protein [Trichoderma citrinoviride]PTB67166.1 WLM-domain-containing protein [Trichoderma citrinoviride]